MARWFGTRNDTQLPLKLWEDDHYSGRSLTGIEYEETLCKTALNPIPGKLLPFNWSINPYRGCSHACPYCFARPTHEFLDLNIGEDFERHIVVKTNIAEVLRRELRRGRNRGELVAQGTNTDPYQRAERLYRLTRAVLEALSDWHVPTAITTKSPAVVEDRDVLAELAKGPGASVNLSVGSTDVDVWRQLEPFAPRPDKRLEAVRRLNQSGVPSGVLMAPIVPFISDRPEQLEATVAAAAKADTHWLNPIVLHLRPKVKEHFIQWLRAHRPELIGPYQEFYGRRSHAPSEYRKQLSRRVSELCYKYGVRRRRN